MVLLLPLIHQICTQLLTDQSEMSVTIQKQILKIFFALIQVGQSIRVRSVSLYRLISLYRLEWSVYTGQVGQSIKVNQSLLLLVS